MSRTTLTTWGSLPAVRIDADDGASAIVTLYGAQLVSWRSADGRERLFCSALSARDGSRAIRGGVPVIFPQFAARGSGMRHGFARVSHWRLDAGPSFVLSDVDLAPAVAAAWPHRFSLRLSVALGGNTLELALEVDNCGNAPFGFAAALHSYYAVDDVEAVRVAGVQPQPLAIGEQIDQVFANVGGALALQCRGEVLQLAQAGFTDAVVWNPGAREAAALPDLGDDEYRGFVCVEPALVDPVSLASAARWRGTLRVTASSIP